MTEMGTQIAAFVAALAAATGGVLGGSSGDPQDSTPGSALVVDAAAVRDGRDLVDARVRALDAEVRLPRTPEEARTDLRYLAAQGYRIVVAGPQSGAAAAQTGSPAERAGELEAALAAVTR